MPDYIGKYQPSAGYNKALQRRDYFIEWIKAGKPSFASYGRQTRGGITGQRAAQLLRQAARTIVRRAKAGNREIPTYLQAAEHLLENPRF
jgi:hypothetical protein